MLNKPSPSEEHDLVARTLDGDPDAFTLIVQANSQIVRGVVSKLLSKMWPEDIDDVCQEVWTQVYTSLESYEEEGKLSAWIGGVSRFVCLNYIRTKSRHKRIERRPNPKNIVPGRHHKGITLSDGIEVVDTDNGAMEVTLESEEILAAVQECISNGISQGEYDVFVLRVLEELPFPQIAQRLEITENNARQRFMRARRKLSERLGEMNPFEE